MRTSWIHAANARLIASCLSLPIALAFVLVGAQATGAAPPPFIPPAGWNQERPPAGFLGVWVHGGDEGFRQNMVVGVERTQLSASQFADRSVKQLGAAISDFKLGADQSTTVCNGLPARYVSYGGISNGIPLIYEQIVRLTNGYAWFAIYTRAAVQPSLPEAREALTSLCGSSSGPPAARPNVVAPAAPTPAALPPSTPTPYPTPFVPAWTPSAY